jgi:hypothetical protein
VHVVGMGMGYVVGESEQVGVGMGCVREVCVRVLGNWEWERQNK